MSGNTIGAVRIVLVGGCAAVGALLGAWAPLLVYRLAVPAGARPMDACSRCRAVLPAGWRGWLRVGARCPACHTALTARSWVYVAATAVGFAALAWRLPARRPADVVLLVAWLLMTAVGTVLAGVDISAHRLPRPILAGTAAVIGPLVGVAALLARDPRLLTRAGLTGAAFGVVYLILALAGPGLVGMGDVYLAALLGLLLGTGPTPGVLVGALAPYLVGGPVTAARLALRQVQRSSQVAWGPYLITGSILAKVLIPL